MCEITTREKNCNGKKRQRKNGIEKNGQRKIGQRENSATKTDMVAKKGNTKYYCLK